MLPHFHLESTLCKRFEQKCFMTFLAWKRIFKIIFVLKKLQVDLISLVQHNWLWNEVDLLWTCLLSVTRCPFWLKKDMHALKSFSLIKLAQTFCSYSFPIYWLRIFGLQWVLLTFFLYWIGFIPNITCAATLCPSLYHSSPQRMWWNGMFSFRRKSWNILPLLMEELYAIHLLRFFEIIWLGGKLIVSNLIWAMLRCKCCKYVDFVICKNTHTSFTDTASRLKFHVLAGNWICSFSALGLEFKAGWHLNLLF